MRAGDWDFLVPDAVLPDLKATTKENAIQEIVGSLAGTKAIPAAEIEGIVAALLRREELASTGIGRGVAIPHTRHHNVPTTLGTVARTRVGIDFGSLDGQPVHLIFLIVSPLEHAGRHLQTLELIARCLGTANQRPFLKAWRPQNHK